MSERSLLAKTSRAQLFLAVIQAPAARFTVGALDSALWPPSSPGGCILTKRPSLLLSAERRSASLSAAAVSQANEVPIDTSDDKAQHRVSAGRTNYHPAHKRAGEIQPDKARCLSGSSTEGHPRGAGSARRSFLRKNKAAFTRQER